MENNKVIIYTLVILLIAAVIFNPMITGNALSSLWTTPSTNVYTTSVTPTAPVKYATSGIPLYCTNSLVKGGYSLTIDQCTSLCSVSFGKMLREGMDISPIASNSDCWKRCCGPIKCSTKSGAAICAMQCGGAPPE